MRLSASLAAAVLVGAGLLVTVPPAHADGFPLFTCGVVTEMGNSHEDNYRKVVGEKCTDGGKTMEWTDVSEIHDVSDNSLWRCGQVKVKDYVGDGPGSGGDVPSFQGPYRVDGVSCTLLR